MARKKQKIEIEIINPQALEQASINKTEALVDMFWDKLMNNPNELKRIMNSEALYRLE